VHDDAETVAAVVAGALEWRMATRVAELARAGRRPWLPDEEIKKCEAVEWHVNRHGRRAKETLLRTTIEDGKKVRWCVCPVTYLPYDLDQIRSARNDYLAWWAAVHEVRERLIVGRVLRDHELSSAMPPAWPSF
jgi:hypothetical protein